MIRARQLTRRERLRHVVVRADLEADDAVELLVASGEHHDRHVRLGAHPPADLEAVDPGRPMSSTTNRTGWRELGERLLAGPEPEDLPAVLLLEVLLDEPADRLVVLDEQKRASRSPATLFQALDLTTSAGSFTGRIATTRIPGLSVLGGPRPVRPEHPRPRPDGDRPDRPVALTDGHLPRGDRDDHASVDPEVLGAPRVSDHDFRPGPSAGRTAGRTAPAAGRGRPGRARRTR